MLITDGPPSVKAGPYSPNTWTVRLKVELRGQICGRPSTRLAQCKGSQSVTVASLKLKLEIYSSCTNGMTCFDPLARTAVSIN